MLMLIRNCFSNMWNWASNYVRFSKGAIFISGLVLGDVFLDNAFTAFLVWYIWDKLSLRRAAAYANAFEAIEMFTSVILFHVAFDRLGNFKLLVFVVPTLIIALLVLWLSGWLLAAEISNKIFYAALTLLMIGTAGQSASLYPFLCEQFYSTLDVVESTVTIEDQFSERQKTEKDEDTIESRANFWKYIAVFIGTFASSTLASNLHWKHTFMVSLIMVGLAYIVFCSGKCYYKHVNPTGQTAASRMKQAKPLVKLLPLWTTFIVYSLVEATGYTLFIQQSANLDHRIDLRISISSYNRIPLTSFYVLQNLTSFATSLLSDFLIQKFWSSEEVIQQRARFVRMGVGMFFGFACCMAAWGVEIRRLNLLGKSSENATIRMTILWLAPQFMLLGIARGLVRQGLRHFFYDRVPVSMWALEFPFNGGVLGIGRLFSVLSFFIARPWIDVTIDESHLDRYLLALAILNILALFIYAFLSYKYDWNVVVPQKEAHLPMEEEIVGSMKVVIGSHSASLGPKSTSTSKSWSNRESLTVTKAIIQRFHSWPNNFNP